MVNKSYLSRYIDESAFRYNTKELTEGQRFELMFDIAFGKKCQYSEVKLSSYSHIQFGEKRIQHRYV